MIKLDFAEFNNRLKEVEAEINDLAEYYASRAIADAVELQMTIDPYTDEIEESLFWNAEAFDSAQRWFTDLVIENDRVGFSFTYRSNEQTLAGKMAEVNAITEKYAASFFSDVQRIIDGN